MESSTLSSTSALCSIGCLFRLPLKTGLFYAFAFLAAFVAAFSIRSCFKSIKVSTCGLWLLKQLLGYCLGGLNG